MHAAESAFRDNLIAMELESDTLHKTVDELKQQGKVKDKACSELKRLKGIITAQDEQVCKQTSWKEKSLPQSY